MKDHLPTNVSRLSRENKNETESSRESSLAALEKLQQPRLPSRNAKGRIVLSGHSRNKPSRANSRDYDRHNPIKLKGDLKPLQSPQENNIKIEEKASV